VRGSDSEQARAANLLARMKHAAAESAAGAGVVPEALSWAISEHHEFVEMKRQLGEVKQSVAAQDKQLEELQGPEPDPLLAVEAPCQV
jgi:hypothetical protein